MSSFKHHSLSLPKIYLRLLPLLLSLSVLAAFFLTQPQTPAKIYYQLGQRLNLSIPNPNPTLQSQPVEAINQHRQSQQLKPLQQNSQLDQTAHLLALDLATQTATDSPQLDIKTAAQLAGYSYQHITFLTHISSLPLVQTPEQIWLQQNSQEILAPNFKHIGTSQLKLPSPQRYLAVAVLASPLQPTSTQSTQPTPPSTPSYYTGVQLWQKIQQYRRQHGVPEFKQDNSLCTIASIRINQLIQLEKLDDHQGFEPLVQEYQEKNKISFNQVAENILSGYPTPQQAIQAWDGSLGHQALMQDGSYVWACAAANHGYAVLVAAY